MTTSALHEFDLLLFDLLLCEYVRGTIGGHMDGSNRPDQAFAKWITQQLGDGPLLAYLLGQPACMLLNKAELQDLEAALPTYGPLELGREWIPWPGCHKSYRKCLAEIREGLSKATANEFAEASAGFGERLAKEGLELGSGMLIVMEWIELVRGLKRDLGMVWALPQPKGEFPTPTHPSEMKKSTRTAPKIAATVATAGNGSPDEVFSPRVAAKLMDVSPKHVIRLIQEGKLKAKNVGRGSQKPRYRLTRRDLDDFIGGDAVDVVPKAACKHSRAALPQGLVDHFPV